MTTKINVNKNKILTELCLKQRKKIDKKYFLELNDLIRLLKNIDNSIFNKTECVLWKGYLTKSNNNKSCYVNFYLKNRKLALHRILYLNFVNDLDIKHYLKFSCDNPGKCCNVNHILKVCDECINQTDISNTNINTNPNTNTNANSNTNINTNLSVDLTNDINPEIEYNNIIIPKKNLSKNIKITKINSNTNTGKIVIIFDD
jgi:hypothetical protein